MLSAKQAESIISGFVQPLNPQKDVETIDLLAASGRILATSVKSSLDFPHWDNSAMDGYAVRFADVLNSSLDRPSVLEIIEEIPAGYQPQHPLQPGQAARIFTGAILPAGADTIVMQEETRRDGNRVFILAPPAKPQAFVRHQGTFYQAGSPLLTPGTPLNAPEIAILAAIQCTQVPVYRRLRVALLSTGDELVSPDQPLQRGQLVDSNQYALATAVAQLGAEPLRLGIIPDDRQALEEAIARAITLADVVLSTGGVSVGDYDYVEEILALLGGEIHIREIAIKPGKPLTFATLTRDRTSSSSSVSQHPCLYFGLPGNPVSTLVTFWRFVQPVLKKLSGLAPGGEAQFVQARSRTDLRSDGKRETYIWGQLHLFAGVYEFEPAHGNQNSANLINLAQTNGLAVIPMGQTWVQAGELVEVLKIN